MQTVNIHNYQVTDVVVPTSAYVEASQDARFALHTNDDVIKMMSNAITTISPCDGVKCHTDRHQCTDTTGVCDKCKNEWVFGTVPADECKTCGKTCNVFRQKIDTECSKCECKDGFFGDECMSIGIYGAISSSNKGSKTIEEYNNALLPAIRTAMNITKKMVATGFSLDASTYSMDIFETRAHGNGYRTVYVIKQQIDKEINTVKDYPNLTSLYNLQSATKRNIKINGVLKSGKFNVETQIHDPSCLVKGNTATPKCQTRTDILDPKVVPVEKEGGGSNAGAVAGGVIGGLVAAGVVAGAAWYYFIGRHKRSRSSHRHVELGHSLLLE